MTPTEHFSNPGQNWGFSVVRAGFVTVRLDLSFLSRNVPEAQAWLGEQVLQSCRAYMPMRTGSLIQRSHTEDGGKKVVFPGPYGRFQHGGLVMIGEHSRSPWARAGEKKVLTDRPLHYSRAEAVDHWFETAKATDKDYWVRGTKERLVRR